MAPRKHSRPVLSEVCPLLYKTVEKTANNLCVKNLFRKMIGPLFLVTTASFATDHNLNF